jgi:hypothetical protein
MTRLESPGFSRGEDVKYFLQIAYVERRRAEGRTTKEIRRCLKRYLARHDRVAIGRSRVGVDPTLTSSCGSAIRGAVLSGQQVN